MSIDWVWITKCQSFYLELTDFIKIYITYNNLNKSSNLVNFKIFFRFSFII